MTRRLRHLTILQAILIVGMACGVFSCIHKPETQDPDALQMQLVQACRDGNIGDAKRFLENGAKVNGDQDLSNRPLFVAVRNHHTALALVLLDRGVDPGLCDSYGTNALMFACWKGEYAVAARCLADGVDPDIPNKTGEAPLLFAASFCHPDIVQLLLEHGADPRTMDAEGLTTLHWAAFRGCSDALAMLLNAAPDLLNQTDQLGRTPLIMAAISGETEAVRRLLEIGADPDIKDHSGNTTATQGPGK